MCDSLKQFKEEMEKRGLFRKITVTANLITTPTRDKPEIKYTTKKKSKKKKTKKK